MRKYLIAAKSLVHVFLIPPGPDPYREQWKDKINQRRLQEAIRLIRQTYPAEAAALNKLVEMRYDNNIVGEIKIKR